MPDTPNYNQSTVAGNCWQRCYSVQIDNPLGGKPSLVLNEEKVYVIGDKTIRESIGNLSIAFDETNPVHQAIYYYINEEYIRLRNFRDTLPVEEPIL